MRRPSAREQLVALCNGVVIAIAKFRPQQPLFACDTVVAALGCYKTVDVAVHLFEVGPPPFVELDTWASRGGALALVKIFQAKANVREWSESWYIQHDTAWQFRRTAIRERIPHDAKVEKQRSKDNDLAWRNRAKTFHMTPTHMAPQARRLLPVGSITTVRCRVRKKAPPRSMVSLASQPEAGGAGRPRIRELAQP